MSEKKMHIMHIIHNLGHGGMEGGVVNIANSIEPEKFQVSICCLEKSGSLEGKLDQSKTAVFVMGKKKGKKWRLFWGLYRLFKENNVDIVHTHNYGTLLYGGVASLFCPEISLVHGEHGDLPLQLNSWKSIFVRKFFGNKAAAFHAVSKSLRKLLIECAKVPEEKVKHIPNGLDLQKFDVKNREAIRKQLSMEENEFIILGVGSFHPWKNYELLIETAKNLKGKLKNFKVILVGEGPLINELKEKAGNLIEEGYVEFLGYRTDVPNLLASSDCLVQPSLTEGMSNTIMEAMASSRPVIALNVGGNSDIVIEGQTGFLVDKEKCGDLVDKIVYLSENKDIADRMGSNARQLAEREYSIGKMVKSYEELYLSVKE